MESKQMYEIRAAKADEMKRLAELIDALQRYQLMKGSTIRIPSKEDLERELTRKVEGSDEIVPNKFCTYPIVAIDHTRLDEPNQAYIVGYLLYSHSFSILHGRFIYMNSFFIEESYRRKGIGRKFMEYLRLQGLALGSSRLDVPYMNNNYKGQSFYATFGSYSCNKDYETMIKMIEY